MTCCWVIGLEGGARPRSPDGSKLHDCCWVIGLGRGARPWCPTMTNQAAEPRPTATTSAQGRPKNRSPESKTTD
jgi:hypothetical protein